MENGGPWIAGLLALGLAVVHLFASRLKFLGVVPRSRWLSMAGGASVAYVFLHLFPEMAASQQRLEAEGVGPLETSTEIYLLALLGLAAFYGLERTVRKSRGETPEPGGEKRTGPGLFWLHVISFALYNALVGYLLLHREDSSLRGLLLFFLAMALHFLVNDFGLREHHKSSYDRKGRWVLALAVLLGWVVGTAVEIDELHVALLFAFLAGGIILNVLKEELPEDRESRFSAFVVGAMAYGVLLVLAG